MEIGDGGEGYPQMEGSFVVHDRGIVMWREGICVRVLHTLMPWHEELHTSDLRHWTLEAS